jgi:quinol monooxygenase YgiN
MADKVAIFAKLQAPEGKGSELEAAVLASIPGVDAETGTELYVVHRSEEDADVVRIYELYSDADAQAAHMSGQALKDLGRSLKGLLAGAPELIIVPVLGGKGI